VEQHYLKSNRSIEPDPKRRSLLVLAIIIAVLSLTPTTVNADGIDVLWLMTRVGGWRFHPALSLAILAGLMFINYGLNVVVIGIPSARVLNIRLGRLLRDLAVLTVLAQVADRASTIAGFSLSFPVVGLMGLGGEDALRVGFLVGVALNFVLSGLVIGLLALWYLRRRWGLERRPSRVIATVAGVITNPAWSMILWFISR
jgi:hypothetical protein